VVRLHSGLGRAARREKVLAMLDSVHLPDVRRIFDSYPHQLSGGQRQRIVIAMALILQPRLLIADEPTTALDVTTQRQILLLMRELQHKHGTAILFITHDFGVVSEIADRIVVMNRGSVVEVGSRDDILARPQAAYTRMLISSVPSLVPRAARPRGRDVVLEVAGLDKRYTEHRLFGPDRVVAAASDVNLSIAKGEILGVVGESGSGKSTVARCVVRLIEPTAGEIRLKGRDIAHPRPARCAAPGAQAYPDRVPGSLPFAQPAPGRRVGESIIEGLLNNGVARATALDKARELLVLVGLPPEAMNRYPHQFSGGQRQRICIARALALEPDILVADEAVSALDVSVQAQVLTLLEEIRERTGVAVLFITHDLRVAAQICDTIVVMKKGRIVESGPAATVLTNPREAYTHPRADRSDAGTRLGLPELLRPGAPGAGAGRGLKQRVGVGCLIMRQAFDDPGRSIAWITRIHCCSRPDTRHCRNRGTRTTAGCRQTLRLRRRASGRVLDRGDHAVTAST
jgi:peptide/nickel transport system ATP-binding protein